MQTEERFLASVSAFFAFEGVTFEADLPEEEEVAAVLAAARAAGVELEGGETSFGGLVVDQSPLRGPLRPLLAPAFRAHNQVVLTVEDQHGVELLYMHDDVDEVYVHLEEDEAAGFLASLREAGFELEARPPFDSP